MRSKLPIYKERLCYKPFDFQWAFLAYRESEDAHWTATETRLDRDVADYKTVMNDSQKAVILRLMLVFTQLDVDVGGFYLNFAARHFKAPELRQMISSFAAREGVHQDAYSHFADTLGLGDVAFQDWTNYPALVEKHDIFDEAIKEIDSCDLSGPAKDYLKIAVYSTFGEGVGLFTSFAILLSFNMTKVKLVPGLGSIVNYSIRDERLHYEAMTFLAKEHIYEYLSEYEKGRCKEFIGNHAMKVLAVEDAFLEFIFEGVTLDHVTIRDCKDYLRTIVGRRVEDLGFKDDFPFFNTFPTIHSTLLDDFISDQNGSQLENFFEIKATQYSRTAMDVSNIENCKFPLPANFGA